MNSEKFQLSFQLFDESNRQDPNKEIFKGVIYPKELLYSYRMTLTLDNFAPNSSEEVQLAARSQHICRWEKPRDSYEANRKGYLLWRQSLKKFHSRKASEILKKVGYDTATIERVCFLIEKKHLKRDKETQLLEDVVCLVFLEFYFENFSKKHSEEKVIEILQKTWKKMSIKCQRRSLKLPFSERSFRLVERSLM